MRRFETPKAALKQVFGYDDFRGLQEDVVREVVAGGGGVGFLPAGGGERVFF